MAGGRQKWAKLSTVQLTVRPTVQRNSNLQNFTKGVHIIG